VRLHIICVISVLSCFKLLSIHHFHIYDRLRHNLTQSKILSQEIKHDMCHEILFEILHKNKHYGYQSVHCHYTSLVKMNALMCSF
jgi:hypothetical protein